MRRTRTIAYVRVSTSQQADKGVSLDAQRAKVDAYSALYDLDVVEVIVDAGVSAKTLDGGASRCEARSSHALGPRSRRPRRTVLRAREGPALLSVGEQIDTRSAGGRLVLNVLASVSQWEREAIGERTATAMQHKAASGEYTGGVPPYGFRLAGDGVHLVAVEAEQAMLAVARELRAAGLSLRAVTRELDARGLKSRVGRAFSAAQIRGMVA